MGTRQQRRKKTHLGARRRYRRKELGGRAGNTAGRGLGGATTLEEAWGVATTLPQEGFWTRRQHRRKRLGGTDWAIRSRTNTRTGQKRRPMAPNRARIWRANEKEPDLLQFSPGSRNRVKASTALNRHYTEGPDGYTRRVLLKLQQIAIRCIRQGGTGAR